MGLQSNANIYLPLYICSLEGEMTLQLNTLTNQKRTGVLYEPFSHQSSLVVTAEVYMCKIRHFIVFILTYFFSSVTSYPSHSSRCFSRKLEIFLIMFSVSPLSLSPSLPFIPISPALGDIVLKSGSQCSLAG